MSKLEHKLFFFLLRRWADKNRYKTKMPNGVYCLIKDRDYDLRILEAYGIQALSSLNKGEPNASK